MDEERARSLAFFLCAPAEFAHCSVDQGRGEGKGERSEEMKFSIFFFSRRKKSKNRNNSSGLRGDWGVRDQV
jgi:hypothetical protein